MLDICDMKTRTFTVVDFRDAALPKIEKLLNNNKKPIIVGGTTYYIETLLWKVLISSNEQKDHYKMDSSDAYNQMPFEDIMKKLNFNNVNLDDNLYLHNALSKVDPVTAQSLHPNNTRKIRRALEVYIQVGRPMSEVLEEQKSSKGSSYLGGPMRFEHVILLWIKSDQAKLNARIDRRIDSMVNDGMLFEVRQCYNLLKISGIDPQRGIMQAIGFKEFLPYLEQYTDESFDTEITEFIRKHGGLTGQKKFIVKNRISDALKLLENCLDDLRLHTKQYSKRQIKWIRNRLVSTKGRNVPPVYELDSTDAETNWNDNVFSKAEYIIQSYIDNVETKIKPAEKKDHLASSLNMHVTHFCDVCNRRFVGDLDFNVHMKSSIHRKTVEKHRKLAAAKINKQSILTQIVYSIWNFCNETRKRIFSNFSRK
ncbi:tRNA dimethylallyltransferase isoform X2 [Contarinia nasturtii]|nr:tRNA dimethylallyltransferase isoform X2 [Contarinia nasturtii]XP_031635128.1 tRNA dimethylallyltransferase isoform X2 [Contarinia nasturtii]XP_031635129.1 tRNA dimethylallyltransferase isoform X2 [Contarinia nasturtii]XP_031635130.1 tRNA dimethylallyltransferase isoform X2 [Contarinia nasturtii]XP_031635131.1 tRNA dimethylallyltransferase isoform X2 [Contarinia nasturtii]